MNDTQQPQGWRKEWGTADRAGEWIRNVIEQSDLDKVRLRCAFHTRLVIPARMTPSGTRYVANPGEEVSVYSEDHETLLGMTSKRTGCSGCGSSGAVETPYFEEV